MWHLVYIEHETIGQECRLSTGGHSAANPQSASAALVAIDKPLVVPQLAQHTRYPTPLYPHWQSLCEADVDKWAGRLFVAYLFNTFKKHSTLLLINFSCCLLMHHPLPPFPSYSTCTYEPWHSTQTESRRGICFVIIVINANDYSTPVALIVFSVSFLVWLFLCIFNYFGNFILLKLQATKCNYGVFPHSLSLSFPHLPYPAHTPFHLTPTTEICCAFVIRHLWNK